MSEIRAENVLVDVRRIDGHCYMDDQSPLRPNYDPIVVEEVEGSDRYRLVDGHHRLSAAIDDGLGAICATILCWDWIYA